VRSTLIAPALLLASAAAVAGEAIEATTGAPRLDVTAGSPARLQVRVAYEHDSADEEFAVPAERDPWSEDGRALYAFFGAEWGKRWTAVVIPLESSPPLFLVDLDRDGDLRDEQPAEGVPHDGFGGGHRLEVRLSGLEPPLILHLGKDLTGIRRLYVVAEALREGRVEIGDARLRFIVQGRYGTYGDPFQDVYFDTDGDGEIELGRYSDERYVIGDEYVNLAGRSWSFEVDPAGDRLRLEALKYKRPGRFRLGPGNLAPDVSFADVDGEAGRISDYRGKVLLLYLWGTWCAPCKEETPHLRQAFDTYYGQGLEILGVAKRDEPEVIRDYVKRHGMPWRQTAEPEEGAIVTLYRAQAVPNMVLIGRDGRIVRRALRGRELMAALEPLFADE
jgi:peroxiredoxin